MSFTTAGYTESIDTGAALDFIAALVDQHLTTSGDDVTVPAEFNQLAAVWAMGVDLTRVRMESPSLRRSMFLDVSHFNVVAAAPEPPSLPAIFDMWRKPVNLDKDEDLRTAVINDGVAASRVDNFIWLMGQPRPLPEGRIDTLRLTGATTLTANVWSLVPLTASQQLTEGEYELCGKRTECTGGVFSRSVFSQGGARPGVIAFDDNDDNEWPQYRRGGLGFGWGRFGHKNIPQDEIVSRSADTANTTWLDLIRTGASA